MPPCYSGPNPIDHDDRMAIWRWAKANAIDHGLPIDKVGDSINTHFFAGQDKPEWITDILSGRKTPFRELANDAWRKQYNRRQIVLRQKISPRIRRKTRWSRGLEQCGIFPGARRSLGTAWSFQSLMAATGFTSWSWGVFFKGLLKYLD